MIAGLVSILLTQVLGNDRFHLLQHIKRPKGKVPTCMKPWCKRKSAVFTIEISLDDLIMKLVQNIPVAGIVSLTIVENCCAYSDVAIRYELLGYWICVVFEIFICG